MTKVIINPHSSNKGTLETWIQKKELLKKSIGEFDYEFTKQRDDATTITSKALKDGYTWIIAIGGDGTINESINGFFENGLLINKDAVFSFIMLGTGSDFVKSFNLPSHLDQKIQYLKDAKTSPIDLIKITTKKHIFYSNNVSSIGLGADVAFMVNHSKAINTLKKLNGKIAFFMASFIGLLMFRNKNVEYETNGIKQKVKIKELVIANGKYYGGSMLIAPNASIDDGLLDIILLKNLSIFDFIIHNPKLYKGKHLNLKEVEEIKTQKISIDSDEKIKIQVDGEVRGVLPASFEIEKSILKVKMF